MPIIRRDEYDEWAGFFLLKYCPEALSSPMQVPIEDIVSSKMNLRIVYRDHMSPQNDILGFIAFKNTNFPLFDPESNENILYSVPGRTVLIETSSGQIGRIRNSLTHEAVHYAFHRRYFMLNLLNKGMTGIQCSDNSRISETSDIDYLEIQARAIAPRILMPFEMFKAKADEFINGVPEISDLNLSRKLAQFFGVSAQSANIRLKELGYDVESITYSDVFGTTSNGSSPTLKPVTTDLIEVNDAFELFKKDLKFRSLLESGCFAYREGRFYTLDGADSIKFRLADNSLNGSCLFRSPQANTKIAGNSFDDIESLKKGLSRYLEDSKITKSKSFSVMCRELLENRHMKNQMTFANRTNISNKNIYYSIIEDDNYVPSLDMLVAILIGLDLSSDARDELLALAGYTLNNSELQTVYRFILDSRLDIHTANDLLVESDFPPLGERHYQK